MLGPPVLDLFLAPTVESTVADPPVPVRVVVVRYRRGIAAEGLLHNRCGDVSRSNRHLP